jgi:transposase
MQSFDGNASDQASLVSMIQTFVSCFQAGEEVGIFVSDSGIYSAGNIQTELKNLDWITRVPETIHEVKALIETTQSIDLQPFTSFPGYRYKATSSNYGGVAQRWLLVQSNLLAQAVQKTYDSKGIQQKAKAAQKIEKKKSYWFKEASE